MARKGLGKGLDSLIPDFYNEDFDSNSTQSLEDILNEDVEEVLDDVDENNVSDEVQVENDDSIVDEEEQLDDIDDEDDEDDQEDNSNTADGEKVQEDVSSSEDLRVTDDTEESVQSPQEVQRQKEHVDEVKAIVDKNPRITLWSSRSSAVFRYLRKTEPEFSISKEASVLIDEAVAKKYPEIWALFEDV